MTVIRLFIIAILLISTPTLQAAVSLSYTRPVAESIITIEAAASTGLNGGINVVNTTAGLRLTCTSASPSQVRWSRFSSLGAAYAENIIPSGSDASSSWIDLSGSTDMGYVVEDGSDVTYLWITDHSTHPFTPGTLTLAPEQDCGRTALICTGEADEIVYYSINGRRLILSRDIVLSYDTLVWNAESVDYVMTPQSLPLTHLSPTLHTDAPLCPTAFTLEGDRFMREWGCEESYTSTVFQPHSISAHTEALSDTSTSDNEISSSDSGTLGGSAPVTVTFSAKVTDAAIFHEWQISRYADFDDISFRASELDFTHTFTEQGTLYVRLYCANSDASCEYYGETYTIAIGESMLKCPNAFSPGNQDGVNDLWKVTYSSIIEFECHIFNRYGKKIISLTDPSQGWDGRYGGRFVPAGAYYYVIKARGADGKEYKLSGDINIVEYN